MILSDPARTDLTTGRLAEPTLAVDNWRLEGVRSGDAFDDICKCCSVNGEGDPFTLETDLAAGELDAYGEVLAGILTSDPSISVRGDVAEQCWRIVTPILEAWKTGAVPLDEYPAGSAGPAHWH